MFPEKINVFGFTTAFHVYNGIYESQYQYSDSVPIYKSRSKDESFLVRRNGMWYFVKSNTYNLPLGTGETPVEAWSGIEEYKEEKYPVKNFGLFFACLGMFSFIFYLSQK